MELERGSVRVATGPSEQVRPIEETIAALVAKGLRTKLITESLVTGQRVELDFHPSSPETYRDLPELQYPEIPSVPSDMEAIRGALASLGERMSKLPIEELFERAAGTLESMQRILDSEQVASILSGTETLINSDDTQLLTHDLRIAIKKLDDTLADAQKMIGNTDDRIAPLMLKVESLVDQFSSTADEARTVLTQATALTGEDSELVYRANSMLREIEAAMRSLRTFLDLLEQNPEALLRGKKSPKVNP